MRFDVAYSISWEPHDDVEQNSQGCVLLDTESLEQGGNRFWLTENKESPQFQRYLHS